MLALANQAAVGGYFASFAKVICKKNDNKNQFDFVLMC